MCRCCYDESVTLEMKDGLSAQMIALLKSEGRQSAADYIVDMVAGKGKLC